MSGPNFCRLCRSSCNDSVRLRDVDGRSNDIYSITIKFFHPTFLDVEPTAANPLAVLCLECWHHISVFNNYQQTVLLLQDNLLKALEPIKNVDHQSQGNNLPDPRDTIVIADDFEDVDPNSQTGNTVEVDQASQMPSSSGFGTGQLIVTDSDVRFEVPNVGNLTDSLSIANGAQMAFRDNESISLDDEYESNEAPGDVFIVDELNDDEASWEDESVGSLDNSDCNQLLERQSVVGGSDSSFTITERKRKNVRGREAANDIDAVIAKWKPTLECHVCSKSFNTFTLVKQHFHKNHPQDEFYVLCCDRKLKYRFRAEEHAIMHLDPKAFKCAICDKCFTTRNVLKNHMNHVHAAGNVDYKHVCDICGKSFQIASKLREHYKCHNRASVVFPCKYCDITFEERFSRRVHMNDVHPEKKGIAQVQNFIRSCTLCPATFTYRTGYYQHLKRHHPAEFAKRKTRRKHAHKYM